MNKEKIGKIVIILFIIIIVCVLTLLVFSDRPQERQSGLGVNWTRVTANPGFSPRDSFSTVVFRNKIWIIGGLDTNIGQFRKDIWYSEDGRNWFPGNTSLDFLDGRGGQNAVVFDDKIWIMGGSDGSGGIAGDIWSSDDGIIWTQVTPMAEFGPRTDLSSVVFNDRLWIMGGERDLGKTDHLRDVWYSSDGISWQQASPFIKFKPLWRQNLLAFDGSIWDIGNVYYRANLSDDYNEIWKTKNGRDWTPITSHAPFPARSRPGYAVFDDRMWIIGGVTFDFTFLTDVWYSSDGRKWTQATKNAGFSENTTEHSVPVMFVLKDKMWIIRSYSDAGKFKNDIWYSENV